MKVLIIDDSATDVSMINQVLSKIPDVSATFSTNPKEAIEMAILNKPDLIILDVVMPEMDGISVAARLSISDVTKNIPVIFVTANTDTATKLRSYQVGCIEYLTKPIDISKLMNIITQQSFVNKLNELMSHNRSFASALSARA